MSKQITVVFYPNTARIYKGPYKPDGKNPFVINPSSMPLGVPLHFWKLENGQIVEMSKEEKDHCINEQGKKINSLSYKELENDISLLKNKLLEDVKKELPRPEQLDLNKLVHDLKKDILDEVLLNLPEPKKEVKVIEKVTVEQPKIVEHKIINNVPHKCEVEELKLQISELKKEISILDNSHLYVNLFNKLKRLESRLIWLFILLGFTFCLFKIGF